jgi:hypothetical protein
VAEADHLMVIELLRQLTERVDALTREIAITGRRSAGLTQADRRRIKELLPAVSRAIGSELFSCKDLVYQAGHDAELGTVLTSVLGEIDSGATRRLGKLLRRSDGLAEDDLCIKAASRCRDGVLWQVLRV